MERTRVSTRIGNECVITAAICHPLDWTSDELVATMIAALDNRNEPAILQRVVPFEIIIPESV